MSRFSHTWTGGTDAHVFPAQTTQTAQTEASRAAPSPTPRTPRTTDQISPLAAYSRGLLEFHRKLWNESRRKSELQSRVSLLNRVPARVLMWRKFMCRVIIIR